MATKKNHPVDPQMTAVAIAYKNEELIADQVMPRITPISQEEFTYWEHNLAEGFTVPNTLVGARGQTPEIDFNAVEHSSKTTDYGLEHPIPQTHIDSAPSANYRQLKASNRLTEIIQLGREVRVARIAMDVANYDASNILVVGAADKFTTVTGTGNPLKLLEDALARPVMRPNTIVFPQEDWSAFRMHPKVVSAAQGNSGQSGLATRERVAELLEVREVLVGKSRHNVANIAAASPNLQRCWVGGVALLYLDVEADNESGTTWGFTVPYGPRVAMQWHDKNIGIRGGIRTRVGEGVKEVVSAKALGYFLKGTT